MCTRWNDMDPAVGRWQASIDGVVDLPKALVPEVAISTLAAPNMTALRTPCEPWSRTTL